MDNNVQTGSLLVMSINVISSFAGNCYALTAHRRVRPCRRRCCARWPSWRDIWYATLTRNDGDRELVDPSIAGRRLTRSVSSDPLLWLVGRRSLKVHRLFFLLPFFLSCVENWSVLTIIFGHHEFMISGALSLASSTVESHCIALKYSNAEVDPATPLTAH